VFFKRECKVTVNNAFIGEIPVFSVVFIIHENILILKTAIVPGWAVVTLCHLPTVADDALFNKLLLLRNII